MLQDLAATVRGSSAQLCACCAAPQVHPAPGPEEVNWQALWLNWRQRDIRGYITAPLWLFIVFFPIGIFTGALSQLDYVLCAGGQVGAGCAAGCRLCCWLCAG